MKKKKPKISYSIAEIPLQASQVLQDEKKSYSMGDIPLQASQILQVPVGQQ